MLLIVGLGNPGKEYERTRHNLGFIALDRLHKLHESDWQLSEWTEQKKNKALVSEGRFGREKIILAKPQTFMNKSGEAVQLLMKWHNVEDDRLVVVHDDMDFPFEDIRMQFEKNAGGHNGVQSVIDMIGTNAFWRVRIGVGRHAKMPGDKFVLQKLSTLERFALRGILKQFPLIVERQFLKEC